MGDRLDQETDKAWAMFQDFRDMGLSRRTDELLGRYRERQGVESVPTTSRQTADNWSCKFKWAERVKVWDAEQERLKIANQTTEKRAKWDAEAEAYRDRNKRFGAAAFEAAIVLLSEARLAIEPDKQVKKKRASVFNTDQALRAFAIVGRLAESSQSTEGTALGITQLLEEMHAPE